MFHQTLKATLTSHRLKAADLPRSHRLDRQQQHGVRCQNTAIPALRKVGPREGAVRARKQGHSGAGPLRVWRAPRHSQHSRGGCFDVIQPIAMCQVGSRRGRAPHGANGNLGALRAPHSDAPAWRALFGSCGKGSTPPTCCCWSCSAMGRGPSTKVRASGCERAHGAPYSGGVPACTHVAPGPMPSSLPVVCWRRSRGTLHLLLPAQSTKGSCPP